MRIHFIQHNDWVLPGEYLAWAQRNQYEVSTTRCWRYDTVPEKADADLLVVLGGLQCPATTKEECDYFDATREKKLIRSYAESGKMVIGVCLGAQLVGEALGASYSHSPEREVGPVEARLTSAGRADPFFAVLGVYRQLHQAALVRDTLIRDVTDNPFLLQRHRAAGHGVLKLSRDTLF